MVSVNTACGRTGSSAVSPGCDLDGNKAGNGWESSSAAYLRSQMNIIRIEDDILVTEEGSRMLGDRKIPITVEELEAAVGR